MGDKHERIKKSLNISEYPWSSDDDDDEPVNAALRAPPFSQPVSELGPSTSNYALPGPSGLSSSVPQPRRQLPPSKMEKNLFWSLLNNAHRIDYKNLNDISKKVHPDEPRTHKINSNPLKEIKAMLALKKSRFCQKRIGVTVRPSRNPIFNQSPSKNGQLSKEAALKAAARYRNAMERFNAERARKAERQAITSKMNANEPQPSTSGLVFANQHAVDLTTPREDAVVNVDSHRHDDHMHVEMNYSDDVNILLESSKKFADLLKRPKDLETVHDRRPTEISLVEEVLEIEPSETQDPQKTPSENVQQDDNTQESEVPKENKQKEEESAVKRKTEAPETGKELNQSLLRLLECPVCLEWMEPPMSQCRRGHLVCVACRGRLTACPVCRATFSSVRNRAMEEVAEMVQYPCRHGCGRSVRLRWRAGHEGSCPRRRYACPVPACAGAAPREHSDFAAHCRAKHPSMLKVGTKHRFLFKLNADQHYNRLVMAMNEIFHLRVDVDVRAWAVSLYVSYIGPQNKCKNYIYETTVVGKYSDRKLVYSRSTHSDLESASINLSRRDCFYLTLDEASNFLRGKNRQPGNDNSLILHLSLSRNEKEIDRDDSCDSAFGS